MDSQKIPLRFKVLRYRASMERPNERTTGRTFTINLGKVPSFLSTIYPRCNGAGIKSAVAESEADKEGDTHAHADPTETLTGSVSLQHRSLQLIGA